MVIIILFTAYTIHRIAFFNRLTCWLLVMLVFYKTERSREFPRGRGGGTSDFKWQGWSSGGKNQNPRRPLDQYLTPKTSHAEFPSHKNFQKALNGITRKIETLILNTQKNPYLNQAVAQKILAKIFLPKKIPKSKILNTKPQTGIKDMTTQEEYYFDSSHYYFYGKCTRQQMRISVLMFFLLLGTEPPDAAIEHAGIIALQAQEIQVDHSVSKLMQLCGNS